MDARVAQLQLLKFTIFMTDTEPQTAMDKQTVS